MQKGGKVWTSTDRRVGASVLRDEGRAHWLDSNAACKHQRELVIYGVIFLQSLCSLFHALTLFLAPALCHPCQLIMLLPQLAEALSLLLQPCLQLQDEHLTHTSASQSNVSYGRRNEPNQIHSFKSDISSFIPQ